MLAMAWHYKSALIETIDFDKAEQFFSKIELLFDERSFSFFKERFTDRLNQAYQVHPELRSENLSTQISSSTFVSLISTPPAHWPTQWRNIEHEALTVFSCWPEAWAYYQLWKLHNKYLSTSGLLSQGKAANLTNAEHAYQDELIKDISSTNAFYHTLHCDYPMTLVDAIVMVNLSTLVLEQKWYEILYSLEQSQSGAHFLLTTQTLGCDYPTLVSSAKVQGSGQANDWLYFSPFFQTKKWKNIGDPDQLTQLEQDYLIDSISPLRQQSTKQFDSMLWSNLSMPEQSCEIIRLTVSGTTAQRLFFLYLAQKRLMQQLHDAEFNIAFVIIEQPLMIQYYASLPSDVYLPLSSCQLSGSDHPTYKGVWNIARLSAEFSASNFRSYKQQTVYQMKRVRRKELNHA